MDVYMSERIHLKDILSIPNAVSAMGLGLVIDGSIDINSVKGVTKIATGRGLDLFDGALARLLVQTSDFGAGVDAVGDKVGMGAILTSAWYHEAVPRSVLATLAVKHSTLAGLTIAAQARHPEESYRPTRAGKASMAADNVALFGYLYANAFEREDYDEKFIHRARTLGRMSFATGLALSLPTTIQYAKRIS